MAVGSRAAFSYSRYVFVGFKSCCRDATSLHELVVSLVALDFREIVLGVANAVDCDATPLFDHLEPQESQARALLRTTSLLRACSFHTHHKDVLLRATNGPGRWAVVFREVPGAPVAVVLSGARLEGSLLAQDLAVDVQETVVEARRDVGRLISGCKLEPSKHLHGRLPRLPRQAICFMNGNFAVDPVNLTKRVGK